MARYWNYYEETSTTTSTTAGSYYSAWTHVTGATSTTHTYATSWIIPTQTVIRRYVITGFEGWSDQARAVLTRLVNDETNTGFTITLWARDIEITDPDVMLRDLDWFLFELRRVASAADYQKIADHVAQVRAELASGIEAPSGVETGNTDSAEGKSPPEGDAQ